MIERIAIDGKVYFKNSIPYWNEHTSMIARSVSRVLEKDDSTSSIKPELRHEFGYYISLCNMKGFANTDIELDACARRYLAGKRKVSPPFTKTRKRAAIKARKARESVPKEAIEQIDYVMTLPIAKNINDKSINALVGMVLKKHKFNPQIVKELIKERVNPLFQNADNLPN